MIFALILVQIIVLVYAEDKCDLYELCDPNYKRHLIFTRNGSEIPELRSRSVGRIYEGGACDYNNDSCTELCCVSHELNPKSQLIRECNFTDFILLGEEIVLKCSCEKFPTVIYPDTFEGYFPRYNIDEVHPIHIFFLLLSTISLSVTFAVYIFIDSLRNLPGKIVLGYIFTLLMKAPIQLYIMLFNVVDGTVCVFGGYFLQFSYLSSFFWLNVMCFDIWWTFSGKSAQNGLNKEKSKMRFCIYCLYSWGCPCIIVIATSVISSIGYLKSGIGDGSCFFESFEALLIFFYGFITVIVIINLVMFVLTMNIIIEHKKKLEVFSKASGSQKHAENQTTISFRIYMKLFIIMGVSQLAEIVHFFLQDKLDESEFFAIRPILSVIGAYNEVLGVMIFIVFVCKQDVVLQISEKMLKSKKQRHESVRSNSTGIYSDDEAPSCKLRSYNSSTIEKRITPHSDFCM